MPQFFLIFAVIEFLQIYNNIKLINTKVNLKLQCAKKAKNIFTRFIHVMKINNSYSCVNNVNFRSYNKLNPKTNLSVSTSFYHDLPTLKKAVEIMENNFPKGADILVYAGSNGEEAISIFSLFKNPEKYSIFSIDPFKEAVDYAKRGIFSIHKLADDGFLINENSDCENQVKDCFFKCMQEVEKPPYNLNNYSDIKYRIRWTGFDWEKFFSLKPNIKENIKFLEGDIKDIESFKNDKPIGGIFFRNALYHLTDNNLMGVLEYGDKPNIEVNRRAILKDLINKIDKKLAPNGIFVMGNHTQEHLYLADNFTPFYNKTTIMGQKFMTVPPHIKALMKNGHFKSCFEQEVRMLGDRKIKMPLIWQKSL